MDNALIVILALLLNIIGSVVLRFLPSGQLSQLIATPAAFLRDMERKLNREHRSSAERNVRGVFLVIVAITASLCIGGVLGWLVPSVGKAILLACALPLQSTWARSSAIRKHLHAGNIAGARDALSGTVFRHHAVLDAHGVARAGIEYLAVQFADKIMSPIFWFLAFGLPGLLIAKTVCLLEETLAAPTHAENPFGAFAHKTYSLLFYIPARLTALLFLIAAVFLPAVKWNVMMQRFMQHFSLQNPKQFLLFCSANIVFVSLGGPTSAYYNASWIGIGTAKATHADVARARFLFALQALLLFLGLGLFTG